MKCLYNFLKYSIRSYMINVDYIGVMFYLIVLLCRILDIAEAHNVFDNMDKQGIEKI